MIRIRRGKNIIQNDTYLYSKIELTKNVVRQVKACLNLMEDSNIYVYNVLEVYIYNSIHTVCVLNGSLRYTCICEK